MSHAMDTGLSGVAEGGMMWGRRDRGYSYCSYSPHLARTLRI
jgi:hypothetical protein